MANSKDQQWREAAHKVIEAVAKENSIVVSDMVVAALESAGLGLDNYSALGGVFTRAAKAGYIQKTDETQHSTRGKSHSAKTVWASLIYRADDVSPEARALNSLLMACLDFNAETVRYASTVYRAGGLDQKTHKRAVRDFQKIQDNYSARIAMIMEQFERVGGKGHAGN